MMPSLIFLPEFTFSQLILRMINKDECFTSINQTNDHLSTSVTLNRQLKIQNSI